MGNFVWFIKAWRDLPKASSWINNKYNAPQTGSAGRPEPARLENMTTVCNTGRLPPCRYSIHWPQHCQRQPSGSLRFSSAQCQLAPVHCVPRSSRTISNLIQSIIAAYYLTQYICGVLYVDTWLGPTYTDTGFINRMREKQNKNKLVMGR